MSQAARIHADVEKVASANRDGPIDSLHLAKQCLGDEELEREVLAQFSRAVASYGERLMRAETADELSANLQVLRGASAGVGAFGLVALVTAAEGELAEGRPISPERIADISMAIEETRTFIAPRIAGID